jgi:hypothetical protein
VNAHPLISLPDLIVLVLFLRAAWWAGKGVRHLFLLDHLTIWGLDLKDHPIGSRLDVEGYVGQVVRYRFGGVVVSLLSIPADLPGFRLEDQV